MISYFARHPRFLRTLCVLGLMLLAGVAVLWFFNRREWRAAIATARGFERTVDAQSTERDVLWGEAMPGDAWDDYRAALDALPGAARGALNLAVLRANPTQRDALLDSAARALDALRRGTHRAAVHRPFEWKDGFNGPVPNLLHTRTLANLAALHAERLLERDRPIEAARWLLDAAQFGRDLLATPRMIDDMIGGALVHIALDEAARIGLHRFGDGGFETLARGLARLDKPDGLPPATRTLQGEAALMMRSAQTAGASALFAWSGWWFGGWAPSARSECVASVAAAARAVDALRDVYDRPWSEVDSLLDAFDTRLNYVSSQSLLRTLIENRRRLVARIRMTRMALQFVHGDEVTPLPDPFGDRLTFTVDDTSITIERARATERPGWPGLTLTVQRAPID